MISLLFGLLLFARAELQVPALTGPVVDSAGMLSERAQGALDRFLRELNQQTGTQIQVATIPDLGGLSIEEASIKITDKWKLGTKKADKGLLLLFAVNDRKVRIEVGQGLEGEVPDVVANRIIREVIIPRMREGSPDRAALDGVMAIVHYTNPDYVSSEAPRRVRKTGLGLVDWIAILFSLFFFLIVPLLSGRGRRRGIFTSGIGGGFGGGGFGGGGWGGGSSGGGGWSGGGGGFSGGGSSGSW